MSPFADDLWFLGSGFLQSIQTPLHFFVRAARAQGFQLCRLLPGHAFIDVQGVRRFFFDHEFVCAHDDFFFGFGGALVLVGSFGNFFLRIAALDGFDHAAHGVELAEIVEGALFHFERQGFKKI